MIGLGLQVMVNEEVDPALVIRRLKQEIRDLKDEIRSALHCAFALITYTHAHCQHFGA